MDLKRRRKTDDVAVEVEQCLLGVFPAVLAEFEVWWTQV